jgi:hypothetical protein
LHLIGQSKWFVSAEGYNHLLGFYESFDGGSTWPVQGHVPGYEGWVDNADPVGAFDPWCNFYSLVLAYQFYYDKAGGHKYDNGSNQMNPLVPPEAVAVSVHPATTLPNTAPAASWITIHGGPSGLPDDGEEREHQRSIQAVDHDRYEPDESPLRPRLRHVDAVRAQSVGDF